MRVKNSDIAYYFEYGDSVLEEIAGVDSTFMTRDDALENDPWTPLEIDRSDPRYLKAVTDTEAAIEAIRADNGFSATYPEQRAGILSLLEDGLVWLRDRAPSRAQIYSLLVSPLQWLSTTFSKAILGEAAKKAAQSLVDLVRSLL